MACNSIAKNNLDALHPGLGQYCTSCFRTSLELGGRPLPLGQLLLLFNAISEDFRLKSVDMSNMGLDGELLQRLPKTSFSKTELALLDLSFNSITIQKGADVVAAFCGSAMQCACLVLDSNPLGDTEAAALFVLKLMERPILRLCLNSCGLGDAFAVALGERLKGEPKRLPHITALELQSNAISADSMNAMLNVLVPRCPALKQLSLYGNGFESIGPLASPMEVSYTKTHLDAPRRRAAYERRLTKKPKAPKAPKPEEKGAEEVTGPDADRIAEMKALAFLKAKAATGIRIAGTPHVAEEASKEKTGGRHYGLPGEIRPCNALAVAATFQHAAVGSARNG